MRTIIGVLAVLLLATHASAKYKPKKKSPPPAPPGPNYPPLSGATCPLALNKWVVRQDLNGQKIEAATNADSSFNGTGIFPSVSLARVTLAPCGVRTMHLHQDVDEMLYVVSGSVGASLAFANGTICEQSILNPGDSFLYTRNLIHSARNPSCTNSATVLGFFTAFNSATANAAAAAFNMPGGPFAPYAAANQVDSIKAAVGPSTLSFDPQCLKRCGFGPTGGQNPV